MDTNGVVENHLDENRNENTTEIKDYDVEVANNPEKEETDTADDVAQSKKIVARNKSEGDTDNDDTKSPEKKEGGYTVFSVQELRKAMEIFSVGQKPAKTEEEASQKSYQFWYTQPVLKMHESADSSGPIESDKAVREIRSDPYSLPHGFIWDTLNLNDPSILKELYILLNENYVEDEDSMFRFDYQPEFLIWALQPPGHLQEWHIGVRVIKTGRLVGFISAIPAKISIYETVKNVVEINFLCVHKKLRSKRVAPVLIREVTRRVNLKGIFQAVYTAGVILPKPVSTCRYWHRSLNPRKLIEAKFSHLSRNMTMQRTIKLYRLPTTTKIPGLRKMQMKDVVKAHRLLSKYLNKYDLKPIFSKEEFRHWFLPQSGVVDSYVVEDQGEITDMISFYTLPSTVMHHPVHTGIKAAYSFYNVPGKNKLSDLMSDALVLAKNDGFDVFNALDLMENKEFIDYLKFGVGDGTLQYYLYNWKCPTISSEKVISLLMGISPCINNSKCGSIPMATQSFQRRRSQCHGKQ